jgi:hypothetical protein
MNAARKDDVMHGVAVDMERMVAEVPLVEGMIYTVVNGKVEAIEPPEKGFGNYDFCYQNGQVIDVVKSVRHRFKNK